MRRLLAAATTPFRATRGNQARVEVDSRVMD